MKFIHLSDLHIGKHLYHYNMKEDQEHILEEVIGYTEKLRPDAVVIAGDIYDKAVSNTKISVSLTVETTNRESSEDRQMPNRPPRKPRKNPFLNDLIRILILRELIGGGRPRFPVL